MNQKPIFDFSFPHEYEVDLAEELPGSGQNVIYHPGASTTGGKDGMLLRFMPLGAQEWLGCFAFGHSSYRFSGIFTTPNPHHACVISSGTAYWVNAKNQLDCSILKFAPVLDTRVLSEGKLLLMSDFVSIALVDVDGVVWRSPRLCWTSSASRTSRTE